MADKKVAARRSLDDIESIARRRLAEAKNDYDVRLKYPLEYAMNMASAKSTKAPGTAGWRANYAYPSTSSQIRTYVPRLIEGLVGPDATHFFSLKPRKIKGKNGIPLRASAALIEEIQNAHMSTDGVFYDLMDKVERNSCTFGVGYIIQSWEDSEETFDYFRVSKGKDLFKDTVTKRTNKPSWYCPSTTDIFVDPSANNWTDKTYVTERRPMRLSLLVKQIEQWTERERFNNVLKTVKEQLASGQSMPSDGNINNAVPGSNSIESAATFNLDPVQMVYNIYAKGEITTMWMGYCIRYVENPFAHGNIPVYAFQFEPDFYRFAPKGLPIILSDLNEAQSDVLNLTVDNWKISSMKIFAKKKNAFIPAQDLMLEPGKVLNLENPETDLVVKDVGNVHMDSFTLMDKLAGLVNQAAGSMDYMNAPSGVATVNKTYGGARLIKQEANQQMARIIKHQKETALKPMLQDLLKLYYQFLDSDTVADIIGEDSATRLNWVKEFEIAWEEEYDYEISADLSMSDKQSRLENIEQGAQLLTQIGAQIDPAPIALQIIDTLELPKSILKSLTPAASGTQNATPTATSGATPTSAATTPAPSIASTQPSNTPAPPTNGQQAQLTPDEVSQIPQIAQALGIDPDRLMADLQNGIIPNFQVLLHLIQHPELIKRFTQELPKVEQTQA